MASISKLQTNKSGERFWRIYVSRGRGKGTYTTRFKWPEGYSEKAALRELNKKAAEFEIECRNGLHLSRKEQKALDERLSLEADEAVAKEFTFRQYGENVFMPAKTITTAENTRLYYRDCLNNHLYKEFGELRLSAISSALLREYFLSLQNSELSYSTVIGIYVTAKQLFKMAFWDEILDSNPMDRVQRPRQRKDSDRKQEVEAFTLDELKTIITYLDAEPLKWNTFSRLLIETGMRRGEACGLKWENINFDTCTATICGNLQYSSSKGVYWQSTKTGQSRDVPFSSAVAKLLKRLKEQQKQETEKRKKRLEKEGKPLDIAKVTDSEFVFTEKGYNSPMHPQSPNRYFQKFGEKYGIDIHPHMLRHSFASVAITNGADIASVSEILGHSDKATTLNMYTHADEESKRRAAGVVFAAIGQA